MRKFAVILLVLLPLGDLCWNLANLNIGLVDFYGIAAFARAFAEDQVWPATAYFPAGYPLLIAAGGKLGSALIAGYVYSAAGIALAMWAVFRYLRHMGAGYGWAVAAACLAWISPTTRITAGSPSVDNLFSGVALWFLFAGLVVWSDHGLEIKAHPNWVRYGLVIPALLLPLLRYHGLLVILPVLAILLFTRHRYWRLTAVGIVAAALAIGFNTFTYQRAFQEPLPSSAALQVRTGVEITQPQMYQTADDLFADYHSFAEQARKSSVFSDYSFASLARNAITNFLKFLRRPPVALLLILAILLPLLRRRSHSWMILGLAWVCCYTLALSLAYYTPRGAMLPVILCLALLAAAVQYLADTERMKYLQAGVVVAVLAGYVLSASYAKLVIDDRLNHHVDSAVVYYSLQEHGITGQEVVCAEDMGLLPLGGNRWCIPYRPLSQSWMSDPTIKDVQRKDVVPTQLSLAVQEDSGTNAIIVHAAGNMDDQLQNQPNWLMVSETGNYKIYQRLEVPGY